jgi:hypothetical protein
MNLIDVLSITRKKRLRNEYLRAFSQYIDTDSFVGGEAVSGTNFDFGTVAAGNPLGNSLQLPAQAQLAISFNQGITSGQLTLSVGSRTLSTPDLAADEVYIWDDVFFSGRTVGIESAVAGDVSLYAVGNWKKTYKIGGGTFS